MKKLLILVLAVVLTLSLTVVASAATFDPYIGGRITWAYISSDATDDDPITLNNSGIKLLLKGKISDEDTGTWATIGAKIDGWPFNNDPEDGDGLNGPNPIYDFGINNVGGSNFSIWYSNWENENMNRGQGRIYSVGPAQYHEDSMFDRDMSNVIGIDYKSDNVIVNFGYVPDKNSLDNNDLQIAGTFKFDGGNVHFGYYDFVKDAAEADEFNIGAEFKLGFGTIKADYLSINVDDLSYDGGNITQVAVFFDALKFDVTLVSDSKYQFTTDGGFGYQVRYTGIDNMSFVYKAMEADNDADQDNNFTDFYVGYKYGIFETRLGVGTKGESADNDFVYASIYASFW